MDNVQVVLLIVNVMFFVLVLFFTAKHKLRDKYAFFWIVLSISGIGFVFAVPIFNRLAEKIGIHYMPALILMVAFVFTLGISMYQMTVLSHQQDSIKNLTQEIGLLTLKVEEIKNQQNKQC